MGSYLANSASYLFILYHKDHGVGPEMNDPGDCYKLKPKPKKQQCPCVPWISNHTNITPQAFFDLASYNINDLVDLSKSKIFTNSPVRGDATSFKLRNLSSSFHEIMEQRVKSMGKCWTLVLQNDLTRLGIIQVRFFLR